MRGIETRRTQAGICLLIFLCFLYTGSAYISWLYRLVDLFGSSSADWLSEVVGYLFQALGLLLFALAVRHRPDLVEDDRLVAGVIVADGLAAACSICLGTGLGVVGFGLLMNLLHGAIAGIYLSKLAQGISQQRRGAVFGVAYGLGSIGSWLLSLPMDRRFLHSSACLIAYAVMIVLILLLNGALEKRDRTTSEGQSLGLDHPPFALMAVTIILLSLVKGLGFYFPSSDSTGGTVNLEFLRMFYAVGLIVAGFICDRNRKYGAICCLAALVFPFISFTLASEPNASEALWILGYVFFGFFSVYRVVLFCDVAGKDARLIWMAGFGLMFGRVGDAAGTLGGILMSPYSVMLVSVSAVLFVVTVLLFFALYHKLYDPGQVQERSSEQLLVEFEGRFGLTPRECEVFRLMMSGRSNSEIAEGLYISESTVKFHVKGILKKTSCANRGELAERFRQG